MLEEGQLQLSLVYSASQIAERVAAIAGEIDKTYAGEPVLAICVLKGAFIFFGDLLRQMRNPAVELDFISLSSYGASSVSSGKITCRKGLDRDIQGKNVLIVEDIVDSGFTMQSLVASLKEKNPASLRIATLLDKLERREVEVDIAFSCFRTGDGFFVGYGLDYGERFRSLPGIYEIKGRL